MQQRRHARRGSVFGNTNPHSAGPRRDGPSPVEALEPRWLLATITVNAVSDALVLDGAVTLREAIASVNAAAPVNADVVASGQPFGTNDRIEFNIAGGGVKTIALAAELPPIARPVTIDGYTQTGASPNALAVGNDAVLLIALTQANTTLSMDGLTIAGGGTTVRGLVLHGFRENQISFAGGNAIVIADGAANTGNVIAGNFIGTDAAGAAAPGNQDSGISISATPGPNRIGGTDVADRNLISGNHFGIAAFGADNLAIENNYIGTNAAGTAALKNNASGIALQVGGDNNTVGGALAAARNVISANGGNGVDVGGDGSGTNDADDITVAGNFIGTDATGLLALGNEGAGVRAESAQRVRIVGNVVSANAAAGVSLERDAHDTVVAGNLVGLAADGSTSIGNGEFGVRIDDTADGTLVGGADAAARNIISANGDDGIIVIFAPDTSVIGNYIGTDADGELPRPNLGSGIRALGNNLTVGGSEAGAGNVVSGNARAGISVGGQLATVQGNFVGTNAAGNAALPNGKQGIVLDEARFALVGGTTSGAGNLVSANLEHGLELHGARDSLVQGNRIGTTLDGAAALGNGGAGVFITTSPLTSPGFPAVPAERNTIGGSVPAAANFIAFNGGAGVAVAADTPPSVLNIIRMNSIHSNNGLGIDLGNDGITANDAADADGGPNLSQNFPVLSSVTRLGPIVTVSGTLHSAPAGNYLLDFYASDQTDPSGFGEGQTHLGSLSVTTDAGGNSLFSTTLTAALRAGQQITATATRLNGASAETSEFSQSLVVFVPPPPVATGFDDLLARKLKGEKKPKHDFDGIVATFTSPAFTSSAGFSALVDWGDGSSSAAQIVFNSATNQFEVLGQHRYEKKGRYALAITITDPNDQSTIVAGAVTAV